MARITGVTLHKDKPIEIALRFIFGIGAGRAKKIMAATHVDGTKRTKDITAAEEDAIRAFIESNYRVEGDLRREIMSNIKRLKEISCFRGQRHLKHLPVRGQRTKTNSRTVRGNVRRTMGSGRKDANQKT